jgi:pre-mRNA-processing factor 17
MRSRRDDKGSAAISDGDGAYVGPWARYRRPAAGEEVAEEDAEAELASDEEYEVVEVEEGDEEGDDDNNDDDIIESGTVLKAPKHAIDRRKEVEELGAETTTLHVKEHDYQGRTYMHVPQDLDVSLRKEVGSVTNFIPKRQIHGWKQHAGAVTALRFFPETGHLLLSSGADGTVRLWDPYHSRELLRTYSGHPRAVSDVSFDHDGRRFVSGSFDRKMKLWDTETGAVLGRFSTGKTPHVVRFFPGTEHPHEFVAGMSDNKIVQFDTRVGAEPALVQTYDHHLAPVNTLEFYDDNRRFASSSDDKSVRCWEYGIPVPIKYVAEVHMFPYTRSARHPSGKWIAYQSSNEIVVYGANDKFRPAHKKTFGGHNSAGQGIDVAFSPDGQFVASGDTGGSMVFWDWKTRKVFAKLGAGEHAITCVQWHPQETSKVVCAGVDGQIRYWD